MFGLARHRYLVPFKKYGDALNSHDLLKAIAITLMILDHVGYYFLPQVIELRVIGRFSFPLFFFLIGYSHNYRFKWDVLVLFLAMAVQDATLHFPILPTNILLNVILTRIILQFLERVTWTTEQILTVLICMSLGYLLLGLLTDFGIFGLVLALCGYFVRTKPQSKLCLHWFILTFIAYSATAITGFKFPLIHSLVFITGLAAMFVFFYHYHLQVYSTVTNKNPAVYGVMILARYSLYIYAMHLMLFKLLKLYQYPELYIAFRWF